MRQPPNIESIARVVHETIRAYQSALGETASPAWKAATEAERAATLAGIRYRIRNLDAPASAQHKQWMDEKIASGWTRGSVKDETKKTHPSLAPFHELSETEQRKDMLFVAVVRALVGDIA